MMDLFYLFITFGIFTSCLYLYPQINFIIYVKHNEATKTSIKFETFILICGLILHALTFKHPDHHWSTLGVGQAISLVSWITVLFFTLCRHYLPLEGAQLFILNGALLGIWLGILLPSPDVSTHYSSPNVILHILIALFSYGLITLSVYFAGLMIFIEKLLHQKKHFNILKHIPPLLTLERLLFRTILSAWILLSFTIFSGGLFSSLAFTHKTVLTLLGWLCFASLLFGHWKYGWRGRFAAKWTIWSAGLLFLGYLGSKIVLQFILQRA